MRVKDFALPIIAALLVLAYIVPGLLPEANRADTFLKGSVDVVRVHYAAANASVNIDGGAGEWRVTEPVEWKADEGRMHNLLERLRGLRLDTTVGTRNDERFGIEETSPTLTVTTQGGERRTMTIGKPDSTFRSIFIAVDAEPAVYLADAAFMAYMPDNVEMVMDKTVYDVAPESVTRIAVEMDGKRRVLAAEDGNWTLNGEPVDPAKVRAVVENASTLSANIFHDGNELPEGSEPAARIIINTKDGVGADVTLYGYEKDYLVFVKGRILTVYGFKLDEKFSVFR